jgi:hypothetical protein
MKYFSHTLITLSIILLILVIYLACGGSEYYETPDLDDDEIDWSIPDIEDVSVSDAEKAQRQRYYQIMLKEKIAKEEQRQRESQKQIYIPPPINCKSRCDCCIFSQTPEAKADRIAACNAYKSKLSIDQYNSCIDGVAFSPEACKAKFAKGLIFKTC